MPGNHPHIAFGTGYQQPSMITLLVCGIASAKLVALLIISGVDGLPIWMDSVIDITLIVAFVAGVVLSYCGPGAGAALFWRTALNSPVPSNANGLDALLGSALDAVIQIDGTGRIIGWNRPAEEIFGWSEHDVIYRKVSGLIVPPRWRAAHERKLRVIMKGHRRSWFGRRLEIHLLHRSGHEFPVELTIFSFGEPNRRRIIAFIRDLSQHNLLEDQHVLATTVIEHSGEGIVVTDSRNKIVSVNPAFTEITGFTPDEVIGRDPGILNSGLHDQAFYNQMWATLRSTGRWQGEIWNRRKSGEIYPEWLSIASCRCENGIINNYIAIFSDITARKVAEERMERLAYFDHLTGLPNRALLKDRLEHAIVSSRRHGQMVAVFFLDLDRFKQVNDTYGHHTGDILLVDVADRLKSALRAEDTLSRLGGDEFVIVLPNAPDHHHIEAIARKLIDQMTTPFIIDKGTLSTSTSIGIAIAPADGGSATALIKAADGAMYRAKKKGRGTFCFSSTP